MLLDTLNALNLAGAEALESICGLQVKERDLSLVREGRQNLRSLVTLKLKGCPLQMVHLGCDEALAEHLASLPKRPTYLICGMLNTKDIAGYLGPLATVADGLTAVSIPGEKATLPAEDTAQAARAAGLKADTADTVGAAISGIVRQSPDARVLVCGSLYLAGAVLRDNG